MIVTCNFVICNFHSFFESTLLVLICTNRFVYASLHVFVCTNKPRTLGVDGAYICRGETTTKFHTTRTKVLVKSGTPFPHRILASSSRSVLVPRRIDFRILKYNSIIFSFPDRKLIRQIRWKKCDKLNPPRMNKTTTRLWQIRESLAPRVCVRQETFVRLRGKNRARPFEPAWLTNSKKFNADQSAAIVRLEFLLSLLVLICTNRCVFASPHAFVCMKKSTYFGS